MTSSPSADPTPLVLASSSPRRREILGRLGLVFTVEAADIDESVQGDEDAAAYVRRLAAEKADTVARPGTVTVAADTTVTIDGRILAKPADPADADAMLAELSGRSHEVMTGVCVIDWTGPAARSEVEVATTSVTVAPISEARRRWYVGTGEADDKAGAYGLQGAASLFADRIDGSVTNVIGLPLPLVDELFTRLGVDLLAFRGPS